MEKQVITVKELGEKMVALHLANNQEGAEWLRANAYKQMRYQLALNGIAVTTPEGTKGWNDALVHFRNENEMIKFMNIAKTLNQ